MSTHDKIADLIQILLGAVAQESGKDQDQLSVEVESVITRGLMEAFKRGHDDAHERPTDPPPRPKTPSHPFPAVNPRTSGSSQRMPRVRKPDDRED